MVKNLWDKIKVYCIHNHEKPIEFQLQTGKTTYYGCPKWHEENREPGERKCANRLNLDDYQGLVLKFLKVISDSEKDFTQVDFTNYEYDYNGPRAKIHVKVLKYTDSEIRLGILNKTSIK